MLRQSFDMIAKKYANIKKGNIRLTQSELVLLRTIDPNTTNYRFNVLENEGAALPEEVRLNINDEFVVTHLGIYLVGDMSAEGRKSKVEFFTNVLFPILDAPAIDLLPFYNGYMKIDVNNVNFVDKWNLKKHNIIQQTQFKDFAAVALTQGTADNSDFKVDGVYPVTPMVTLSGAKKNDINIILPSAITGAAGTWKVTPTGVPITITINKVGVIARGMLAQNGAKFQN